MYCRLCDDDTYWLVHYIARYYRRIKRHQHMLVVNKKSIMNHTLAVGVFNVGWKKVEVVKEEGIIAWGKQFYVFAPRRVDFTLHFIGWSVKVGRGSKHTVRWSCWISDTVRKISTSPFYCLVSKRGSWQQTHCAMIMLNFWHCQKNIIGYLWSQDRDNDHLWTYLAWHRTTD